MGWRYQCLAQPLRAQGRQSRGPRARQHGQIFPLPLSRLDLPIGWGCAGHSPEKWLRTQWLGGHRGVAGHGCGGRGAGVPRLCVLPFVTAGRIVRQFFWRRPLDHRQHGRSISRGQAGSGRWGVALHAPLQLEDVGGQPNRHLPPHGGPRVFGRHGGQGVEGRSRGHAQADGGGVVCALRQPL